MAVRRILVGIDNSLPAKIALEFTIDLAQLLGAEVIACHAIGKVPRTSEGELTTLDEYRAGVTEKFEDNWCLPLNESGLRSQKIVVDGNPITTLLAIAEEEEVDMIILGSRTHTIDSFLGSTCHQIIERSHIPIMVVPESVQYG